MDAQYKKLTERIEKIKQELLKIGEMRPGSLSRQFNVCGSPNCRCKDPTNPKKHGPYYQLSYVHKGKSTSQFIKRQFLLDTRRQVKSFKTFRRLVDEWIDLALQQTKLKMEIAKKKSSS